MIIAGIDYSMTSPALCIHDGAEWDYKNCKFYFFGAKPLDKRYISIEYPKWKTEQERFGNLTAWVLNAVNDNKVDEILLEGYAFGATGRVFNIAENTGLLKYGLYVQGIPFDVVSPTTVKKFASGKGNANKEMMIESFHKDTGIDIFSKLGIKEGKMTPSSDIVDAYWICKMLWERKNDKNDHLKRSA